MRHCSSLKDILIKDLETECGQTLSIDLSEHIEHLDESDISILFMSGDEVDSIVISGDDLKITLSATSRPKHLSASLYIKGEYISYSVSVVVQFLDLCGECQADEVCDECTGDCVEGTVDVDAGIPYKGYVKLV